MKIGLVCPYNMFLGGGVQEVVLELQNNLTKRGYDAKIITPQPRDYKGPRQSNIIMVGGAARWRTYGTTTQFSASVDIDKLTSMLETEKFDILHFHEPWAPMLARQILGKSNAVNIGTFHAAIPDRIVGKTIEKVITPYTKSILKYLDALTAVSPAASKYASTLTDMPIEIVQNGIDLKKFSRRKEKSNLNKPIDILYIGRLESRKGLKYLLKAFSLIESENPNYRLTIAGDGPDRDKLIEQAEFENIKNINFVGYISDSEKIRLLSEADLFCSPAVYGESFGIVLLEAMASGCVLVAGNNPGYESVMDGLGQISIINPKDTKEFARRLKVMATNKAIRKCWRGWAQERVKKNDYDIIVSQYEEIYKRTYARKKT